MILNKTKISVVSSDFGQNLLWYDKIDAAEDAEVFRR